MPASTGGCALAAYEHAKRLQEISSLLVGEESDDRLFEEIAECATAVMRSDFGSIQMPDVDRQELRG